jgi:hypothetical protein
VPGSRDDLTVDHIIGLDEAPQLAYVEENLRVLCRGHNATPAGPTDYSVWWRITNTGEHARKEASLRGNFIRAKRRDGKPSDDPTGNWESTSYTGTHLVEVFLAVGSGVVARSDPFKVNIYNSLFQWRR